MGKRTITTQLGRYGKFAIYVAIVILLNVAVNITPPNKIDLTKNDLFSISKASIEAVKTLEEPLTIKIFFSDNLPGQYNTIKPYIRDILKEYSDHANKKYFNYEFLDVGGGDDKDSETVKENQSLATDYGIQAVNIEAVDKDQISYKLAYLGMAFIHGEVIETLTPIQSTTGLEFQITSTIQKMNNKISSLLALDENVKIKLYLTSALEKAVPDITKLPELIKKVVKKLNKENYNKLDFVRIDTTTQRDKIAEAESLNAFYLSLKDDPEKYFGDLFVINGDRYEEIRIMELMRNILFGGVTVQLAGNEDDLESKINDAVSSVININEKIGYLTSNGTLELEEEQKDPYSNPMQQQTEAITNFRSIIENEYTLAQVNLEEGEEIPEGVNCLVIAGPDEEFSDYQLYQIDQFLMQGKSLAVFIDPKIIEFPNNPQLYGQQRPEYRPNRTGLEDLLEHYGVTVESTYVFDEEGYKQRDRTRGVLSLYDYPVIQNEKLNQDIPFTKNIRGLIVHGAAPLSIDKDKLKDNSIRALRLFSSSDKSWTEEELLTDQSILFIQPPEKAEDKQSYDLAYILEGKFTSYFAGKTVPEKPQKEEGDSGEDGGDNDNVSVTLDSESVKLEDRLITSGKPGKIFVMGTSFVLHNRIFSTEISQNMLMYINILDYLNGKEDYAVMRTKFQQYNPLNMTSQGVKNFTKTFNTWIIPVLVILMGLLILVNRRSHKLKLQREFSKTDTNKEEA